MDDDFVFLFYAQNHVNRLGVIRSISVEFLFLTCIEWTTYITRRHLVVPFHSTVETCAAIFVNLSKVKFIY